MKSVSAVLLILLAIPLAAQSDPENDRIRRLADSVFYGRRGLINNAAVPGANIGIYWKGQSYLFSYGFADRERGIRMDSATLLEIGSNTKIFTALLLAKDIVHGRVGHDTKIDAVVPVHRGISNTVRLTDLASYTSGLPTLHDSESLAPLEARSPDNALGLVDDRFLLETLSGTPRLKHYGQYAYSNFAFGLLGYILTQRHRISYPALLQREILDPLQLTSTSCSADTADPRLARGYRDSVRERLMTLNALAPAGAIKSDLRDMLRFLRFQLGESTVLHDAIELSQRTWYSGADGMTGLGWHKMKRYGHDVWIMRGDTYGQSSLMVFDKADSLGIVILLNTKNARLTTSLFQKIFTQIIEDAPDFRNAFYDRPTVAVPRAMLRDYEGSYTLSPGVDFSVRLNGDDLAVGMTGQSEMPLRAVAPGWFQSRDRIVSFEFCNGPDGRTDRLVLHQHGQEMTACKK